jgi:hypothetical protein
VGHAVNRVLTHVLQFSGTDGIGDQALHQAGFSCLANIIGPGKHASDCAYGLDMPANKRPTPEDSVTASQTLLDGLGHDAGVFDILDQLAPLHPRNNTFPGEVFLGLAADALDWSGASRADPVTLEGMRERFLPECAFRGRDKRKLQFAVLAAAAQHGGVEPDLLDEVVWWQTDDFWQYALFAAVAYIRAAADRSGAPVAQVCRDLAHRLGLQPG